MIQAPLAHTCNLSYSGSRNQEDHSSKPAQANSSPDPVLKKPFTKKSWWSGLRWRPWVQTSVLEKKKKKTLSSYFTCFHSLSSVPWSCPEAAACDWADQMQKQIRESSWLLLDIKGICKNVKQCSSTRSFFVVVLESIRFLLKKKKCCPLAYYRFVIISSELMNIL
jgi:hypothetical protein